jgi:hypothetical protein
LVNQIGLRDDATLIGKSIGEFLSDQDKPGLSGSGLFTRMTTTLERMLACRLLPEAEDGQPCEE